MCSGEQSPGKGGALPHSPATPHLVGGKDELKTQAAQREINQFSSAGASDTTLTNQYLSP